MVRLLRTVGMFDYDVVKVEVMNEKNEMRLACSKEPACLGGTKKKKEKRKKNNEWLSSRDVLPPIYYTPFHGTCYRALTLASVNICSGVKLAISSMKAALKVPGPRTSSRTPACSPARLMATILVPEKKVDVLVLKLIQVISGYNNDEEMNVPSNSGSKVIIR